MKLTGTDLFLLADGRWYKAALKYQPYGHRKSILAQTGSVLGDKRWLTRAFRYNNDIMISKKIRIWQICIRLTEFKQLNGSGCS